MRDPALNDAAAAITAATTLIGECSEAFDRLEQHEGDSDWLRDKKQRFAAAGERLVEAQERCVRNAEVMEPAAIARDSLLSFRQLLELIQGGNQAWRGAIAQLGEVADEQQLAALELADSTTAAIAVDIARLTEVVDTYERQLKHYTEERNG